MGRRAPNGLLPHTAIRRPDDVPLSDDFKDFGPSLTVTGYVADQMTLKSVTSYRQSDSNFALDTAEVFNTPKIEHSIISYGERV